VVLVPHFAPIVVMAFLLTGLGLALALIAVIGGLLTRHRLVVRIALVGALVLAGGYGATWAASGLASRERTLAPGERKYFCEIDCHLAYSITAVERARVLGRGATAARARGDFWVVTLETWFDPSTIAAWRPRDVPLTPNPRRVVMVDADRRTYSVSPAGQRALEEPSAALETPLVPGQSYRTRLVFDLPRDVRAPRVLLTDPDPVLGLLIGHENAPLHRKAFFALPRVADAKPAEPSGAIR